MTKTIELRSLLTEQNREINIPKDIEEFFEVWKELREKSYNKDIEPAEIFYAGYILANPMVRDQYKILRRKENENQNF